MDDVPSPIDFHDPEQARVWAEQTSRKRPWRRQFFDAFAEALNARFRRPIRVLELGSGPGCLAERILDRCSVAGYLALDFSVAMHQVARENLGSSSDRVDFVERDFRSLGWSDGLGQFDAVVTMQAAHELRHKRHLLPWLVQVSGRLISGGLFLYCDHYAEPGSKNPDLYLTREEQPLVLRQAGFSRITPLLDEGGMALYSAHMALPPTGPETPSN